jgi:nicotinate-nucleotide adenylyltransferase
VLKEIKPMVTRRKIALFGGTFDPVHLGHIIVSAAAAEHIGAEKIIYIPAKRSPLKSLQPQASDTDRFNMISLAIAGENIFEVSDYELTKVAPSFTLDTVRQFHTKYGGDASIYWLVGADSIDELPHWYHMEELIDECHLCVMYRAGCKQPDFAGLESLWGSRRIEKLRNNIIPTPLVDISSTEVRDRLTKNQDVTQMLHPEVLRYIQKHHLYRSKPETNGD